MNKLFSTIMSVCLACNVQATDLFKTSQDIALRAPSVPLITSDTYLAIWSCLLYTSPSPRDCS